MIVNPIPELDKNSADKSGTKSFENIFESKTFDNFWVGFPRLKIQHLHSKFTREGTRYTFKLFSDLITGELSFFVA